MRTLLVLILAALNYYVYFVYLGDYFLHESTHFYEKLPFAFVGLWFAILMVYDKFFGKAGLWKKSLG